LSSSDKAKGEVHVERGNIFQKQRDFRRASKEFSVGPLLQVASECCRGGGGFLVRQRFVPPRDGLLCLLV
jgi:hypothetical protein